MKEKAKYLELTNQYYNYLLNRFNKANDYFDNISEDKKDNIYSSKEYKAYKEIINQLSDLESIIKQYDLFKYLKEQIEW